MANYCSTNLYIKFNKNLTEKKIDEIIKIIEKNIDESSFWTEDINFNNKDGFFVFLTSKWSCDEGDLSYLSEVIEEYCYSQEDLNLTSFTYNYEEPGCELYGDESGELSIFEYEKNYDSEVLLYSLENFQNDFEFSNSKNIFDIEYEELTASDLLNVNDTIFSSSSDMCDGLTIVSKLIKTKGFENGAICLNITLRKIYEEISSISIEKFIELLKKYSPDLSMFEDFDKDLIKQKSFELFLTNSEKIVKKKCA